MTRYMKARQAVATYTGRPEKELQLRTELDSEHVDQPIAVRSEALQQDFLVTKPYTVDRVSEVQFTSWPPSRQHNHGATP